MELIDRGAAIDAINEIIRMEHSLRPKIYVAKDAIKKLPSVQLGTNLAEVGTDCISRRDAIDAIKDLCEECDADYCGECRIDYPVKDAKSVLETLPAAQPEIVRCKDCKYWKRSSCCEGYCGEIDMEGFDEDHYCGFAEKRGVTK